MPIDPVDTKTLEPQSGEFRDQRFPKKPIPRCTSFGVNIYLQISDIDGFLKVYIYMILYIIIYDIDGFFGVLWFEVSWLRSHWTRRGHNGMGGGAGSTYHRQTKSQNCYLPANFRSDLTQQSQSITTQIHMSQHVQILDKANHNKP